VRYLHAGLAAILADAARRAHVVQKVGDRGVALGARDRLRLPRRARVRHAVRARAARDEQPEDGRVPLLRGVPRTIDVESEKSANEISGQSREKVKPRFAVRAVVRRGVT